MLFSSILFIYLFLPITLGLYYLCPRSIKNYVLLFASLVFFAWGGVSYSLIMVGSVLMNYLFGLFMGPGQKFRKPVLAACISLNILVLVIFKYNGFFIENFNYILNILHLSPLQDPEIKLPVGISFYTFHSLSYVVDIYRNESRIQRNPFKLGLYITLFPQLIAGPIVRYNDIEIQLDERKHKIEDFALGIERFILGLSKKVLIANTFGEIADEIFAADISHLHAPTAWIGLISYSIQIYYDFAGYSDMALGLGKMFGFEFAENFNYPYHAKSIKEFWRRWHISLSTWFRDYVYIPLGGNRGSGHQTYTNLIFVFFITGLWHGANWTFIVWGLFHGMFLILERSSFGKLLQRIPTLFQRIYTLFIVMTGWMLFRADNFTHALSYFKSLFSLPINNNDIFFSLQHLNAELYIYLIFALAGAFQLFGNHITLSQFITSWSIRNHTVKKLTEIIIPIILIGLLLLCSIKLLSSTHNPFIYYRF